jgi:probable F420-dependent oxidoreductase
MRVGLTYLFRNPPSSGLSDSYVWGAKLEQIQLAESLGFDDVWVGEHHFVDDGWLPSPLVAAAAIAARTSRVQIGTFAVLPALHHPIRLAEDCAVVDDISGGRFLLGVALGYRAKEFEVLGVPYGERASRLEETVEILRRCWTEESFSHHGRHFDFEDVRCTPKPTQRPIPIWVGAAMAEKAVVRAARIGEGLLCADPTWGSVKRYVEALAQAGKDAQHPHVAGSAKGWIFATNDPERDWELLRPHATNHARVVQQWMEESGQGGLLGDDLDAVLKTMFLIDTPERIVAEIRAAHAVGGFDRHLHTPTIPGAPLERCTEAIELFAKEVLPAVRALDEKAAQVG